MPLELVNFISNYGYFAIFTLVFLQELGMPNPIPNEMILMFAGYLTLKGILSFPIVLVIVIIADFTGTNILYFIFYFFGLFLIQHKPRWIPISNITITKLSKRISSRGQWTIFIGRLTPYLRGYTSVITGLLHIHPRVFLPIAIFSAFIWGLVCILFGRIIGPIFDDPGNSIEKMKYILPIIVASLIVGIFSIRIFKKRRLSKEFSKMS